MISPIEFGLNHAAWREHQYEAVMEVIDGEENITIVDAPTGSGKTALATAAAHEIGKTVALTRTKNLQVDNYGGSYGYSTVFGRSNYACVLDPSATTAECAYAKDMPKCPQYHACHYVIARDTAKNARLASLNYAYWFHVFNKWPRPDLLVCDEAHQLSDLVLDFSGIHLNGKAIQGWNFPTMPIIANASNGRSIVDTGPTGQQRAHEWLSTCLKYLGNRTLALEASGSTRELQRALRLAKKIEATCSAINACPDDWFIQSGPGIGSDGGFGFVAKPLTARNHFRHFFPAERIVLMSATIGDAQVFAEELGIKTFDLVEIPSTYTPEQMPIMALDVPRIGYKSTNSDYQRQAEAIAAAIKDAPAHWHGLIHTNSIAHARDLNKRLGRLGLGPRLWSPKQGMSTDQTVREWRWQMQRAPGRLAVTWNLQEGYDGEKEKINIIAKIPFPHLGDKWEKARQARNGKLYYQRAAWATEQMLGRTRRGNEDDYDTPDERRGLVAIADGSWKWVRNYFSKHTRDAIVTQ